MLRYLFASVLLGDKKDALKILSKFIKETAYKYVDEFTELIQILTHSFAFDAVPENLAKLKKVGKLEYPLLDMR